MDNYKDIEEAEQADIRRKEKADESVHPRTLAAWLDDATTEALEACDDAMMQPGAQPNNTREILEAGYRLYHSPGYKSAGFPEDERTPADMPTMYEATFRLMQESGIQGPSKAVEVESAQHAKELAFAWSEGQIGHPWDECTIEIPDLDYVGSLAEESDE